MTLELADAADLRPGDRVEGAPCTDPGVMVTILRDGERTTETAWPLAGRAVLRFWGRREDTGAKGYLSYGPGARVLRAVG